MKTKILLISVALFAAQLTSAQILYSENFDNLTLGNVGTDFTGITAGQGEFYTLSDSSEIPSENSNDYFKIVSEPNRGKVLELAATPGKGQVFLQKRGIDALWSKRNTANNILKIEIDFYTGDQFSNGGTLIPQGGSLVLKHNDNYKGNPKVDDIGNFTYYPDAELYANGGPGNCSTNTSAITELKLKTWVKIYFYLDYQNLKYYTIIPIKNLIFRCDLNPNTELISLILKNSNSIGSKATIPVYKYDNLIISAVNTVPLSTQYFISDKFNLYPNPAKNVVYITNAESIKVENIDVFDTNGKLITTKTFSNETNVQFDISGFAIGTYFFHISTKDGTAVKKIIKK